MAGHVRADVSSAWGAVPVDVSATDQTLTAGCRVLYVGTSGDVKIDMPNASAITFANVPAGTTLTVQALKVYHTGTSAANILALY